MQIITQPERFEDTPIDVVIMGGEKWVGGPQIGAALGFADPAKAMRKIYSRSISEFDETTNIMIEMPTAGGRQLVRLYNARGAALIAMKAQTPKGEAFRRWVLDVLEGKAGIANEMPVAPAEGVQATVMHALREMFMSQRHSPAVVRYRSMGLTAAEIRKLLDVSGATVHKKLRVAEYLGLVEVDPRTMAVKQGVPFMRMVAAKRANEAARKARLAARAGLHKTAAALDGAQLLPALAPVEGAEVDNG